MSVKAYRVIEITSETSSFSLWTDRELINFLDKEILFSFYLNSDGTGMVEIPLNVLEKAVQLSSQLNLADDTVNQLLRDIRAAKSKNEGALTYYCL